MLLHRPMHYPFCCFWACILNPNSWKVYPCRLLWKIEACDPKFTCLSLRVEAGSFKWWPVSHYCDLQFDGYLLFRLTIWPLPQEVIILPTSMAIPTLILAFHMSKYLGVWNSTYHLITPKGLPFSCLSLLYCNCSLTDGFILSQIKTTFSSIISIMGSKADMSAQFSKLTQIKLGRFCLEYGIRADLKMELPQSSIMVSSHPQGKIPLYTQYFDQCNLWYPCTKFFLSVMKYHNVCLGQWPVLALLGYCTLRLCVVFLLTNPPCRCTRGSPTC